MVANTSVKVFNGQSPGTPTNISGIEIRFKLADNNILDSSNPLHVPSSGTVYSWQKSTKLSIDSAPDNMIQNLVFFSSGMPMGSGVIHLVGTSPTYTQATSDNELGQLPGTVDSTTYTANSPLSITSGVIVKVSDSPVYPAFSSSSGSQDFVVHQVSVDFTVDINSLNPMTLTYRYDES